MRSLIRFLTLAVVLLAAGAASARASQYLFNVTLSDSNPRFNRPEGGDEPPFMLSLTGTAVPYFVLPWYSTSGVDVDVSVVNRGGQDAFCAFVYHDAFDPAQPLQNTIYQGSSITVTPEAYRQYFVVVCAAANEGRGFYEGELFQPSSGQLVVGTVPEPSVSALALTACAALAWRIRRRGATAPRRASSL